jgi:hypothetical protein
MRAAIAAFVLSALAGAASAQVTISQVHAATTVYDYEFVEVFNRGNAPVDVNGWSIKYTIGNNGIWQVTPLAGVIPAHSYYLIAMAPGSGGQTLPPAQVYGSSFMSPLGGKMLLSNNSDALFSQCPSLDSTVDMVLWGTINCEGAPTAPAMDGTNSILRGNGGCTDTDNSTNDFALGAPNPRTTSTTHSCTTGPDCNGNGIDDNQEVLNNPAVDCNNNGIPDSCDVAQNPSLDCNNNGVIDCAELRSGALTDVNTNNIPDACEGAVVVTATTAAFVLNSGVSVDSSMWRVQGTAVEDVDGRPAPAYAAARWSNASIMAALNSAFPSGWSVTSIHIAEMKVIDPVAASGTVNAFHTNNDTISLAPGNTTTRYANFASNYADRVTAGNWSFAPGSGPDPHALYTVAGPNTPGGDNVLGEVQSGAGTLTLLLSPGTSSVAASYAGLTHAALVGPRLVIFAAGGPTCGTADFNGDGDFGTDQDIEAFFACLAGNCCATCYPGGADFNADGDVGTDQDIESFFRVLAGGPC